MNSPTLVSSEVVRDPWWRSSELDLSALSHPGKVRPNNEDSFIIYRMGRWMEPVLANLVPAELPPRTEDVVHMMIVADGVGGQQAGEVASRTALSTAIQLIGRSPRWALRLDDPETRDREIREMFERGRAYLAGVEQQMQQRIAADPGLTGMATTLTGGYLVGRDLFVMHVGDSKAFVVRDGTLHKITRDHTIAQEYADLGIISQNEVASHRYQHVLTRAVGTPDSTVEADFHHVMLDRGDRVLLCSDGLTDMATPEEILAAMAVHPRSERACEALVAMALEHGGRDNVTVLVAGWK